MGVAVKKATLFAAYCTHTHTHNTLTRQLRRAYVIAPGGESLLPRGDSEKFGSCMHPGAGERFIDISCTMANMSLLLPARNMHYCASQKQFYFIFFVY